MKPTRAQRFARFRAKNRERDHSLYEGLAAPISAGSTLQALAEFAMDKALTHHKTTINGEEWRRTLANLDRELTKS